MRRGVILEAGWVISENGFLSVYDSEGKPFECITMVRVTEKVDEIPIAMVQMVVNVASSKEEMLQLIEEEKKSSKAWI